MRKLSLLFSSVIAITSCAVLSFFLASPARALMIETQKEKVSISGPAINESVVAAGKSVEITSNVNGDVYCVGENVRITGDIAGDVICAAQNLEISGVVEGSVRSVGQSITILAPVDHAVTIAGQDLTISPSTLIGSEMIAAGKNITMNGAVDGKITIWGQNVAINGEVNSDAAIKAQQLSIGDEATIRGTVSYQGPQQASVSTQATVEKPIAFVETTPAPKVTKPEREVRSGFSKFISSSIMMIVAGAVVAYLFPGFVTRTKTAVMTMPLQSTGVGLLVLIGGPILGILMLFTIVGIPFALLWFLVWILLFLVSFIPVAAWAGEKIAVQFKVKATLVGMMVIGCLALSIVGAIPVVGKMVQLIIGLIGLGGMVLSLANRSQKKR